MKSSKLSLNTVYNVLFPDPAQSKPQNASHVVDPEIIIKALINIKVDAQDPSYQAQIAALIEKLTKVDAQDPNYQVQIAALIEKLNGIKVDAEDPNYQAKLPKLIETLNDIKVSGQDPNYQAKLTKLIEMLIGVNAQDPSYQAKLVELKGYLTKYSNNLELRKRILADKFEVVEEQPDLAIYNAFSQLNKKYKYFEDGNAETSIFKEYEKCFKVCHYIAQVIEMNDNGTEVSERAYKMLALFLPQEQKASKQKAQSIFSKVDGFISKHCTQLDAPVHDIFLNELPVYKDEKGKSTYNLEQWQKLIAGKGMTVVRSIISAAKVEEILQHVPKDGIELQNALTQITYKRAKENLELANLYKKYNVSEDIYDKSLDYIKNGTIKFKEKDNIPSISIDIAKELDANKQGYYFVRLPANDPRGMILGSITNCCQSIGGDSERCVIDGMTRQNNGFYVLIKADKRKKFDIEKIDWSNFEADGHQIVGQGYIWRSTAGNLTFDSWENLRPTIDDVMIKPLLELFGKKVMEQDPSVARVTIGVGGKTPNEIKQMPRTYPEAIGEGYIYGDAERQIEIHVSDRLQEVRNELINLTTINKQSHIISIKQAELLFNVGGEYLKSLLKYDVLTSYNFLQQYDAVEKLKGVHHELLKMQSENKNKFDLLFSSGAIEAYKNGKVSVADLKDLEPDVIKVLISYDAQYLYETDIVSIADLKDLEPDVIKVLISNDAQKVYKNCKVSVADLKDLKPDVIKALISNDAREMYKTGKGSVADLKDLEPDVIKVLISKDAREMYKTSKLSVSDFKADNILDVERNILKAYAEHFAHEQNDTLGYINTLNQEKVQLLISYDARQMYKTGKVSVADFKDLELDVIKVLISDNAQYARYFYETDILSIADLKDLEPDVIKALISYDALNAYETGKVPVADLKDLSVEKIKLLISKDALNAYKTDIVSVADLKADNILDIKRNILKAYAEHLAHEQKDSLGYIDALDEEKLGLLISPQAISVYKTGKVSVADLKDLSADKIDILISYDAMLAYYDAMLAYNNGTGSVADLKDLDLQKVRLLMSYEATITYVIGKGSVADLKDLSVDKIKLLISPQAMSAYKTSKVSLADLKDLEIDKTKLLISHEALMAYNSGELTPFILQKLDNNIIKEIISNNGNGTNYVDKIKAIETREGIKIS